MRRNNSSMNRKLVATAPIATPQVDRAVEVADHCGVHQPEQRYGDIEKIIGRARRHRALSVSLVKAEIKRMMRCSRSSGERQGQNKTPQNRGD